MVKNCLGNLDSSKTSLWQKPNRNEGTYQEHGDNYITGKEYIISFQSGIFKLKLFFFLIFSLLGTVDPFGYRWRKKIPSATYAIVSNSLEANGMLLNV